MSGVFTSIYHLPHLLPTCRYKIVFQNPPITLSGGGCLHLPQAEPQEVFWGVQTPHKVFVRFFFLAPTFCCENISLMAENLMEQRSRVIFANPNSALREVPQNYRCNICIKFHPPQKSGDLIKTQQNATPQFTPQFQTNLPDLARIPVPQKASGTRQKTSLQKRSKTKRRHI